MAELLNENSGRPKRVRASTYLNAVRTGGASGTQPCDSEDGHKALGRVHGTRLTTICSALYPGPGLWDILGSGQQHVAA